MGERVATYSLAVIVGIVVVLIGSAAMVAGSESAEDRVRLMIAIIAMAQLIVSLATLALVHRSMSAAVRDGEQAEQTARHLRNLTHLVHELKETTRR
jgi:NADH:ubiquinone oxidoreductase subunit 6 (subunit J)